MEQKEKSKILLTTEENFLQLKKERKTCIQQTQYFARKNNDTMHISTYPEKISELDE